MMGDREWEVIGFTGSRFGMSSYQRHGVAVWLDAIKVSHVHHGCCVGADAEFHEAARGRCGIVGEPGPDGPLRMPIIPSEFDELHEARPYNVRNQVIVDACTILIATPESDSEPSCGGGGTWQTVRRARKAGRRVIILWSNGSITKERF